MDLTTIERVKLRVDLSYTDETQDALLSRLVAGVSAEVERRLDRHVLSTSRTVQANVRAGQGAVALRGYPITSITSIWNDRERDFGDETVLASSDYFADTTSGIVYFEVTLVGGPGVLKITYTGGMAASTDAFMAAYPDIAEAVDQRCAQLYQRRAEIGVTNVAGPGGSLSMPSLGWPVDALSAVMRHRFRGQGIEV